MVTYTLQLGIYMSGLSSKDSFETYDSYEFGGSILPTDFTSNILKNGRNLEFLCT